ncbi:hypothetical protein AKJ62_03250 [candidate division MSBL1 archaeon SCGC-AAA259D14]|uniref:DUF4432 domain-containing protein n=1 Tax=candidate division MSBL1 archaeon SCGC-AAA259D14 TaxID=1698261 RepID=A0A133U5B5_9EURY|nr:hypothetical protein AKJ62_03250 [candidate division MSBL1 archaeon SCGC-AAA259D14]
MDFENNITSLSKRELLERVGDMRQVSYVELQERKEGAAKDCRQASFRTATGLQFDVLIDRGLDISSLYYKGCPLVWRSPVAERHPAYYDPKGDEWLRSFFGGLLTTCGLTHFGQPSVEEGKGLHGRISNTPADNISVKSGWVGNEYELSLKGEIKQTKVFGENIALKRKIRTAWDEKTIEIHDIVENRSFRETPHMIMYHMNFGYPLLSSDSVLELETSKVLPANDRAANELEKYSNLQKPQKNYKERVYVHQPKADERGKCSVSLSNPNWGNGLGLKIIFEKSELPYLTEWKMLGQSEYVLGLEPANCPLKDRKQLERENKIPSLAPQESREYKIKVEVFEGES